MDTKLCSCGMPQSFPIPHEHDRTEREKQIIAYYQDLNHDMYEALKSMLNIFDRGLPDNSIGDLTCKKAIKALAKADGK
jgi:hypothetical protein